MRILRRWVDLGVVGGAAGACLLLEEVGVPLHRCSEAAAYAFALPLGLLYRYGIYALLPMVALFVVARRRPLNRPAACCACGRDTEPVKLRRAIDGLQYMAVAVVGLRVFGHLVEIIAR